MRIQWPGGNFPGIVQGDPIILDFIRLVMQADLAADSAGFGMRPEHFGQAQGIIVSQNDVVIHDQNHIGRGTPQTFVARRIRPLVFGQPDHPDIGKVPAKLLPKARPKAGQR